MEKTNHGRSDDTSIQDADARQPSQQTVPDTTWLKRPQTSHKSSSQPAATSPTKTSYHNNTAFSAGIPIAELDSVITGSMDLSGERKERIQHIRIEETSELGKKYLVGPKLGQGSFGTVNVIKEKMTGEMFACKMIKKKSHGSKMSYEQLQREVAIMKMVRHPHIVQLHEVYETPKKMFLVME